MNTKAYDKLMKAYSERYGSFIVCGHYNIKSRWIHVNYGSSDYEDLCYNDKRPNHRKIFPDELVLDIDSDDLEAVELSGQHIKSRLDHVKFGYDMWINPSKKYHFHLFFSELMDKSPAIRKMYKQALCDMIVGKSFAKKLAKIDPLFGSQQIRAEYGLYEKIVTDSQYKELVHQVKSINKIPDKIHKVINDKLEEQKNYVAPEYDEEIYGNDYTPDCVQQLLSQDFASLRDGRDRALFFLTWWFKKNTKDEKEWIFTLKKYNKYVLNNYANAYKLGTKITYQKRNNARGFSHKYVHELLDELGMTHNCEVPEFVSFVRGKLQWGDKNNTESRRTGD